MTRLKRCQKKALSSLLEHEILPARVLRARIVVSILVGGPCPRRRRPFSGHQHVHPSALVQVAPATQRLQEFDYPFRLLETASAYSLQPIEPPDDLITCGLSRPAGLAKSHSSLLQSSLGPQELSHHPDDLS